MTEVNKMDEQQSKKANGALSGIKVLDFSQLLAGPYATMMLGDMGAEVVKIERLGSGDKYRRMTFGNTFLKEGISPTFLAWNRSKKSLSMDLKDPETKSVLYDMIKQADMVIHNFRPGVMERLGYGYEELKAINPRIIYGCNTGFGAEGPYAQRPGQDLLAQGLSGIMSLVGRRGTGPTPLGTGIADHLSAYHLIYGLLSALYYREKTGLGQKVEVDLFQSMLAFMGQEYACVLNTEIAVEKPDSGIALPFLEAPYGVYECSDGYITVAMNDYEKLTQALGCESLLVYNDPELLYEKRDEIFHAIEEITKKETVAYWLEVMLSYDLWVSRVNDIRDVEMDPQVQYKKIIKTMTHPIAGDFKVIGPAVTMSVTQPTIASPPPLVGEHSKEVLENYGIDSQRIEDLMRRGIIK